MGREERLKVFEDTAKLCKENKIIADSIACSTDAQELILEGADYHIDDEPRYEEKAKIIVSTKRSLAAAMPYASTMKTAVHNFASATNPGGGVTKGSSAQEECLCRCTGLYFNLNVKKMWDGFYGPHRNVGNPIHNDDCIYTPEVIVFKSDTEEPKLMNEAKWYKVDFITCAAPNLRDKPSNQMNPSEGEAVKLTDKALLELHVKRLDRIVGIAKQHKVDALILGAFGCGAFMNPPRIVAMASKQIAKKYINDFKVIEFAVYCTSGSDENYRVFKSTFENI